MLYVDEDDEHYFYKNCVVFDILKELGYRHIKTISSGVVYDCTVSGIFVNTKAKTFFTTDEDLVFMKNVINEIPDYLTEYCIVRKPGKELFDYDEFK